MTVAAGGPRARTWAAGRPVDVPTTLAPLRRGTGDPAHRVDADGRCWWACATPEGDGTLASWREDHEHYFRRTTPAGREFSGDAPVVCERFRLLYPKR